MLRRFCVRPSALVMMLLLATLPIRADSDPVIAGQIHGIEFCPQSICGAAIFGGQFVGSVDGTRARGVFVGAITHEPIPEPGETSLITGGPWVIRTARRTFSGYVLPGGTLQATEFNTFIVEMDMVLLKGGSGTLHFSGVLDHNPFPPTIGGTVF